jgi:hypothetical protein
VELVESTLIPSTFGVLPEDGTALPPCAFYSFAIAQATKGVGFGCFLFKFFFLLQVGREPSLVQKYRDCVCWHGCCLLSRFQGFVCERGWSLRSREILIRFFHNHSFYFLSNLLSFSCLHFCFIGHQIPLCLLIIATYIVFFAGAPQRTQVTNPFGSVGKAQTWLRSPCGLS